MAGLQLGIPADLQPATNCGGRRHYLRSVSPAPTPPPLSSLKSSILLPKDTPKFIQFKFELICSFGFFGAQNRLLLKE